MIENRKVYLKKEVNKVKIKPIKKKRLKKTFLFLNNTKLKIKKKVTGNAFKPA